MSAEAIRRIGRPPTAAEATLQHVLENPTVLARTARNYFASETGFASAEADERWAAMPESQRAWWADEAVVALRLFAAGYVAPPGPPEPRPGAGLPLEASRG